MAFAFEEYFVKMEEEEIEEEEVEEVEEGESNNVESSVAGHISEVC